MTRSFWMGNGRVISLRGIPLTQQSLTLSGGKRYCSLLLLSLSRLLPATINIQTGSLYFSLSNRAADFTIIRDD